jgi:hypothetical protein
LQIGSLKDALKLQTTIQETNEKKIREINETVYKIDNVQIPSITTRLGQMSSKDDLISLKRENDEKVNLFSRQ